MAATLKDIAERAGVSPSTVSRVVRGETAVSESAKLRVTAAIKALGYHPNAAARTIRTGVSHTIGYVVPDITNWFYSAVFVGAQTRLREAGYELVLSTSDGDHARQAQAIESFVARNIDGIILSLASEDLERLPEAFGARPTVLLDRELSDPQTHAPLTDMVLSDHMAGMRAAVRYLYDLGHRRIALLTGRRDLYTTRSRSQAFLETGAKLGLAPEEMIERTGDRSVEAGDKNTRDLLAGTNPPTAIICGSNQLLHGTLRALHYMNIDFPGQVSIIACEDSDICQLHRPSITVVRRDVQQLGMEAASVLLQRIEPRRGAVDGKRSSTVRRLLPTELVLRDSSGPPPSR